jgi:hypothetical protein
MRVARGSKEEDVDEAEEAVRHMIKAERKKRRTEYSSRYRSSSADPAAKDDQ